MSGLSRRYQSASNRSASSRNSAARSPSGIPGRPVDRRQAGRAPLQQVVDVPPVLLGVDVQALVALGEEPQQHLAGDGPAFARHTGPGALQAGVLDMDDRQGGVLA